MRRRLRQLSTPWVSPPRPSLPRPSPATQLGALLPLILLASLGCAPEPEQDAGGGAVTRKAQPVLGGTLSERESVVLVQSEGPSELSVCSGTLVAPNLVLTARHCVSAFTNGDFSCTIDGFVDLTRARTPANAGDMGLPYPAEDVSIHAGTVPDFDNPTAIGRAIFAPESDTICRNDLAFVLLEQELDLDFMPLRHEEGVSLNELTTVVGFGINDNRRVERTERGDLPISAIGWSDFYPVEGNALPRTFVLGTSVCPGDSGGPAFSDESGELLGVFSFFRGNCESSEARNFFTQVAPFRSVALQAFEAAGYLELIEPEEEPPLMEPPEPPQGGAPPDEGAETPSGTTPQNGGCSLHAGAGDRRAPLWLLSAFALFTYRRRSLSQSSRISCPIPREEAISSEL